MMHMYSAVSIRNCLLTRWKKAVQNKRNTTHFFLLKHYFVPVQKKLRCYRMHLSQHYARNCARLQATRPIKMPHGSTVFTESIAFASLWLTEHKHRRDLSGSKSPKQDSRWNGSCFLRGWWIWQTKSLPVNTEIGSDIESSRTCWTCTMTKD